MKFDDDTLYNLTPRQYQNAVEGYERDVKQIRYFIYDAMRIGTANIVMSSGNLKRGVKIRPKDIVRLEEDGGINPIERLKYVVEHSRFPDKLPIDGQ